MRQTKTSLAALLADLGAAHRRLVAELSGEDNGIGAGETLILVALDELPGSSPGELARLLHLSPGRLTHLTGRLIANDLITRTRNPHDGRRISLNLTANGKLRAQQARDRVRGVERDLVHRLGSAGVDMLAQQLRSVAPEQLDT